MTIRVTDDVDQQVPAARPTSPGGWPIMARVTQAGSLLSGAVTDFNIESPWLPLSRREMARGEPDGGGHVSGNGWPTGPRL
jgi:hypothetical protein